MSVRKINGFAAPYRSSTLVNEVNAIVKRNGLLYIESDVYVYSGNIIIPPFIVVQEGLIIQKTVETTVPAPSNLIAPYHITVSCPTSVDIDDLTFQFASTPYDLSANSTILSEYDGVEWRQLPLTSIDGIIRDMHQYNIDLSNVGPKSGLQTTDEGADYLNTQGVLIDKTGRPIRMDGDISIEKVVTDPLWNRVDRLIYRLPVDLEDRIGVRTLQVGNTFSDGDKTHALTTISSSQQHNQIRHVVDSSNNLHVFYTVGFGVSFELFYAKYSSDRETLLYPVTYLADCTSEYFDATLDKNDQLNIIYVDSGNIVHAVCDLLGAILSGPFIVTFLTTVCDRPVIQTYDDKIYIVFQSLLGASNNQLYFMTMSVRTLTSPSSIVTSAKKITSTATNIINPSISVSSDRLVYVAYEDTTLTTVSYLVLDDIGSLEQTALVISASTISSSFGILVNQAKQPKLVITDNKKIFISFLQIKSLSTYGIAIYIDGLTQMPDLISTLDSFTEFSMAVDDCMNHVFILAAQSNRLDFVLVDNNIVIMSEQLNTFGAYSTHVSKDRLGSLVHTWSLPHQSTYINVGTPQNIDYIGPCAVAGTLDTLFLLNSEMSFNSGISPYPVVGERVEIAGSLTNNGYKIITEVRLKSIDTLNDVIVVKCDSVFTDAELPSSSTAQFADPDSNEIKFCKSVAELSELQALRTDELTSDTLLTRIRFPGPLLLNYVPHSGGGINSDQFGMHGDVEVDWGNTVPGSLTMTSGTKIVDLVSGMIYSIDGGSFALEENEALYIELNGVTANVTPQVVSILSLPWSLPIQVLGYIEGGTFHPHLFSVAGMGQLDVGEITVLGQSLPKPIRTRLGITSETTFTAYTSTINIDTDDSHPDAISKLDAALNLIQTDIAKENHFKVTEELGQTVFTASTIVWSISNAIPDITVTINGKKVKQSPTGLTADGDYKKTSTQDIEFFFNVPKNAEVTIRDERSGGGSGGGGSCDLENIFVDIQPDVNGVRSVGTVTKAFGAVYLKDTVTTQVWKLAVANGVLVIMAVP